MSEQPNLPGTSALTTFAFDGAEVRVVTRAGDPWFVLADVCKALGTKNPTQSAAALDADERAMFNIGRQGEANCISEGGLYTLILRSRDATTPGSVPHRFRKWVTAEVLPAIRKTGGYMVAAPEETPEQLALRAMSVLQATVERQKAQLAGLAPKAAALDLITAAEGRMPITNAAKVLGIRPKDLFSHLVTNEWIYRRPGGTSYLAYAKKLAAGLLEHKVTTILRADGSEKVVEQVLLTPPGLAHLAAHFGPNCATVQ